MSQRHPEHRVAGSRHPGAGGTTRRRCRLGRELLGMPGHPAVSPQSSRDEPRPAHAPHPPADHRTRMRHPGVRTRFTQLPRVARCHPASAFAQSLSEALSSCSQSLQEVRVCLLGRVSAAGLVGPFREEAGARRVIGIPIRRQILWPARESYPGPGLIEPAVARSNNRHPLWVVIHAFHNARSDMTGFVDLARAALSCR